MKHRGHCDSTIEPNLNISSKFHLSRFPFVQWIYVEISDTHVFEPLRERMINTQVQTIVIWSPPQESKVYHVNLNR